jgi:hypothetical protein
MKELQSVERKWILSNENLKSPKHKQTRLIKVITRVNARAPTASACEIPILSILFRAQDVGVPTKTVIQEVISEKWFKLSDDDLKARYPKSKRKIVPTVIKYARKKIVLKGAIQPVGENVPIGTWRATRQGLGWFATKRSEEWKPRYSTHDAIIEDRKK